MIRRYSEQTGRTPATWHDLIAAGWLRSVPLDPAGTPFVLLKGGKVTVSQTSRLNPLPMEPPAIGP